ncbi:MAG: PIN domain-containing protein [Methanobrevibacter sp.]|nr:PIN domain-containing protein [Methanobrevibacter sp.]
MIFFDTNVIIDFFIKKYKDGEKNPRHFHAVRLWNSSEDIKVISNLIRIEVINILYLKHKKTKDLIRKVNMGLLNDFVIIDDSDYFDEGLKKLQEFDERLSINECIYLAIMEDYGIEEIVSFDSVFDYCDVRRLH